MKTRLALALAPCVVLIATAIVGADSWPGPRPQVFAAAYGAYGFKTRPPQLSVWSGKGHGTLFAPAADGSERVVWNRELVNIPVRAFVADDGKYVVTLDTWAKLGYEHALVIYGEQGNVVADYDLEALLPADDIARSVVQRVGSRHWLEGGAVSFDEGRSSLVITLHWGKVLTVALSTGRIVASK